MNRQDETPRSVEHPEPGFFRMRLIRKGPWVAARIHHDAEGWWAEIDGQRQGGAERDPVDAEGVFRVWHSGRRIDEQEYGYLLGLRDWAVKNNPRHPAATEATKPIDLKRAPPLF